MTLSELSRVHYSSLFLSIKINDHPCCEIAKGRDQTVSFISKTRFNVKFIINGLDYRYSSFGKPMDN